MERLQGRRNSVVKMLLVEDSPQSQGQKQSSSQWAGLSSYR
jgi:hypothetical protein